MISTLFVNACIVFTLTFIGFLPFQNRQVRRNQTLWVRVLTGVGAGLMGVILMFFAVPIPDSKMIVDLRHLPIVICAVFLGPWASLAAGGVECAARVAIFGTSQASVLGGANILAISLIVPFVIRLGQRLREKVTYANVYALLQSSILIYVLAPTKTMLLPMLILYWLFALFAGLASFWLVVQLIEHFDRQFRLEAMSSVDYLTGLTNLRKFTSLFQDLMAKAEQFHEPLSVLAVDIDFFKRVNDTYGHPAGDAVLRQLAHIMTHTSRSIDTVSRNGGEEFSILLPNCTKEEALQVAERIRTAVERANFKLPGGSIIHITISIGVATYMESVPDAAGQDAAALVELADKGLYHAKSRGRNQVCWAG